MKIQMGMIKLDINIAEIRKSIVDFKANRLKVFDELTSEFKTAFSKTIEEILESEITVFLGNSMENDNRRNGYSIREYCFKGIGTIAFKVPRDRKGKFSSEIIPKHEQIDPRLKEDIAVLHLAGLSTRTLSLISKRVLGTPVSADTVSKSLSLIVQSHQSGPP
jgi:transposase-like protein